MLVGLLYDSQKSFYPLYAVLGEYKVGSAYFLEKFGTIVVLASLDRMGGIDKLKGSVHYLEPILD